MIKRQEICIERLEKLADSETDNHVILQDCKRMKLLSMTRFLSEFVEGFVSDVWSSKSKAVLADYVRGWKKKEYRNNLSHSQVFVKTDKCGHCGQPHKRLEVLFDLDKHLKPVDTYVLCPAKKQRLQPFFDSSKGLRNLRDLLYHTEFEEI